MNSLRKILLAVSLVTLFTTANSVMGQQESLHPALERLADSIVNGKADSIEEARQRIFEASLIEFARHDRADVFNALSQEAFDSVRPVINETTLLHVAAENGATNVVESLLEKQVDVDRLNGSSRSALYLAALGNHLEVVRRLLDAGGDVNGKSKFYSPLNAAAWYGYPELAQLLIDRGAELQCVDSDGNTPLHKAVWQRNVGVVRLLLDAEANVNAKNGAGTTPLEVAQQNLRESESDSQGKRPWGIEQIFDEPDAGTEYSDKEWCPATLQSGTEQLKLYFDAPVRATSILIYAKPHPASVVRIAYVGSSGRKFVLLEPGEGELEIGDAAHVGVLKLSEPITLDSLVIDVDKGIINQWVYYDAVALVDGEGGKHWVKWGTATSSYATGEVPKAIMYRMIVKILEQAAAK